MGYKVLMTIMGMEIGGAETHVLELCKALKRRGLDVYVASNGGVYESELNEAGIRHFKVPLHNKKISSIFTAYFMLKKIIIENDIKLVHAHARIPAFLCGILQKKLHFRFVTSAHWIFKASFPFNILSNWGEKSLAVSEDIKKYLIDNYGMKAKDILITVNGIDCEKFSPSISKERVFNELKLDGSKKHILSISRMDKDRSLPANLLIDVFDKLTEQKHPAAAECELILVGGGNDFERVKEKAEALNKKAGRQMVFLTGARTDINELIAASDIFVNVSRSTMEAMAGGKPVIVAGNEGYIGIFDESKLDVCISTNFCCRGCGDSTADKLERDLLKLLALGSNELQKIGEYAREFILKEYSADKMASDAMELYEMVRHSARKIDVMISGYYGFNNNGDDAILKAIVDDLKEKRIGIKITVLSKKPKETKTLLAVDSIYRFNFPKIFFALRQTNLLITGGGTLLQDLTSTQSLIYYLWVINTAYNHGAKNMLYANGMGPLNNRKNIENVKRTLKKVDVVTFRDEASYHLTKSFNCDCPEMHITADAFFSLKNTDESEAETTLRNLGIFSKYIVITVRSWKTNKIDFEQNIAEFADYIKQRFDYEVIFVPMQPLVDLEISKRIISLMKSRGILFRTNYTLNEILGIISKAEFVLGMRLHSIIYAARTVTPVIGLVYDPKVRAMMQQLNQSFYIDVECVNVKTLKGYADEVIANREAIKESIREAGEKATKLANENTLLAMELINRKEF